MAITTTEGRTLLQSLLVANGEDYYSMARTMKVLRQTFPAIAWNTELSGRAAADTRFQQSGLSINWWVAEVIRISDL